MKFQDSSIRLLPLDPSGGFKGQRRTSNSPYIESVWEGVATQDGTHLTAADGTIDLTFQTRQGLTRLLLSGPTSKAHTSTFQAGDTVLTVRLRIGVHLPSISSAILADTEEFLPNANRRAFWLQGSMIEFPSFNTTEVFVEHLAKLNLFQRSSLVENTLNSRSQNVSMRTIQRHFLATTGMNLARIRQIRRAEEARNLITQGSTLISATYETGYSNPGHMAHSFKHFFGRTPSELRNSLIA